MHLPSASLGSSSSSSLCLLSPTGMPLVAAETPIQSFFRRQLQQATPTFSSIFRLRGGGCSRGNNHPLHKHLQLQQATPTYPTALLGALRGGGDAGSSWGNNHLIEGAYEWCSNFNGPAALVAGAVIATIYDNIKSGDLELSDTDTKWAKFGKKMTRILLFSSFCFEIMSIFVTTVTMTMLMSRSLENGMGPLPVKPDSTPLSFMRDNFEFEYLTTRIAFLQGLFNWLAAVALSHAVPSPADINESLETARMNKFVAVTLTLLICLVLGFYNTHLTFYDNYFEMVSRWLNVVWLRFFWRWPPRLMSVLYVPLSFLSIYWGLEAFWPRDNTPTEKEKM